METKANHLAVGVFVLIAVAGFFAFVMWLGKTELDREVDAYHIYFRGSVSGLTSSSTVRYRGVPVGTVTDIVIDPNNSEQVLVTIEVTGGTPIQGRTPPPRSRCRASLAWSTSRSAAGAKDSPRLVAKEGQPLPVVASVPSALEALFKDIPRAIVRFTDLVERATLLLSDENMQAITDTLQSVRRLGDTLAASSDDVGALTADVAVTAAEIRRAAEEMNYARRRNSRTRAGAARHDHRDAQRRRGRVQRGQRQRRDADRRGPDFAQPAARQRRDADRRDDGHPARGARERRRIGERSPTDAAPIPRERQDPDQRGRADAASGARKRRGPDRGSRADAPPGARERRDADRRRPGRRCASSAKAPRR